MLCPWGDPCRGRDIAETLPRRTPRPARPTRRAVAFWITRPDGAVLLRRRAERGLLGGMIEVPSTEWREDVAPSPATACRDAPVPARDWREVPGMVTHTFTHFRLEVSVLSGRVGRGAAPECIWCPPDRLGDHALPTVMKKIAAHALANR